MDLHATEYFFHAFRYPDFQYLTSFGKRGDAPEEILSAENFRWNGQFLWMLDAGKSKLTRLSFTLSGDSLLRTEVVSLDKEILRALDFVQYDDSTFIIPDYSGDSRFCWVNRQGKLHRKTGTIPTTNAEEAQDFIEAHSSVLNGSFRKVEMSETMRKRLERSNYVFSGLKTFHELNEAFPSLLDENGNRKTFERFLNDVRKIDHKLTIQQYATEPSR